MAGKVVISYSFPNEWREVWSRPKTVSQESREVGEIVRRHREGNYGKA